ncbi:MAG: peptidase S24 [Tannerella sp.]|jgi:DNA polymerase V|nr:peptidase S24 [Tannerella sp.]
MEFAKQTIQIFSLDDNREIIEIPYIGNIRAGFKNVLEDYRGEPIDLNKLIIKNRAYTFIGRVDGTSLINKRYRDGDLIIIDSCLEPRDCDEVVVSVDGEFTVKDVRKDRDGKIWLVAANDSFPDMEVREDSDFRIWGVVIASIYMRR